MAFFFIELVGLSVQEKKFNIDFQDGGYPGHLVTILVTFLSTCHLDTSNGVNWPFLFRRKVQIDFQHG